ncbi:hypothetical protein OTUT144_0332 [Orientia tsutsugamushi str. UT144]|uniref:Transposase n=1 Tax=Orientia tsutsugamushi str. UT144 TaxID=1441384 RepID=A0A0F3RN66_ORITS|nr:hypothetical protein OTUT144_0332 [Orientia tsutsugamushi str. UT144]
MKHILINVFIAIIKIIQKDKTGFIDEFGKRIMHVITID